MRRSTPLARSNVARSAFGESINGVSRRGARVAAVPSSSRSSSGTVTRRRRPALYRCRHCRETRSAASPVPSDRRTPRRPRPSTSRPTAPHGVLCRRFPVLSRPRGAARQLLDLWTPRSLTAITGHHWRVSSQTFAPRASRPPSGSPCSRHAAAGEPIEQLPGSLAASRASSPARRRPRGSAVAGAQPVAAWRTAAGRSAASSSAWRRPPAVPSARLGDDPALLGGTVNVVLRRDTRIAASRRPPRPSLTSSPPPHCAARRRPRRPAGHAFDWSSRSRPSAGRPRASRSPS